MSYISSLNLLGDDTTFPISEEALDEELALWANAQFTFDTQPGSALPDDSYKAAAESHEFFANLANLSDNSNQPLYDKPLPTNTTSTLLNTLPRLAPAPQSSYEKASIQSFKEIGLVTAKFNRKRKSSTVSKLDENDGMDEDKRKRNTAASARFRMKKKLKEQALERTAKEMALKAEVLERRVLELEKEAKWLRALVVEKDPSLLK